MAIRQPRDVSHLVKIDLALQAAGVPKIGLFNHPCLATWISRCGGIWPRGGVNGRILDLDAEMQEILVRLKEATPGRTYETVKAVVESYDYLVALLREESAKEEHLLELLFCRAGQVVGDHERHGSAIRNSTRRQKQRRLAGSKKRRVSG